jgi:hypothetical protein
VVSGVLVQIRAQLAAEGHPLLGDTMYEPLASRPSTDATQGMAQMSMNGGENRSTGDLDCDNIGSMGNIAGGVHVESKEEPRNESRSLYANDAQFFKGDVMVGPSKDARVGRDSYKVGNSVRHLNEPSTWGIGLQACRLEVCEPNNIMGPSPTVFEAPVPWWRETV